MLVPSKCLICGKGNYTGGHALPGQKMKSGLRVFYACGSSLSIKSKALGAYILLAKNCLAKEK